MDIGIVVKHKYSTPILELCKAIFADKKIHLVKDESFLSGFEYNIISEINNDVLNTTIFNENINKNIRSKREDLFSEVIKGYDTQVKFQLKRDCYILLSEITLKKLPWGMLTGIRPVKLVHKMYELNWDENQIKLELRDKFLLEDKYANLMIEIAKKERTIFVGYEKKCSLYISIPFCPTKCVYCSFPTHIYKKWSYLEDEYIEKLCREIVEIGSKITQKIDTIYIGGGTPSSIKKSSIERILKTLYNTFDLEELREFTYEAGRPDTIDKDLLELLNLYKISRISINPQTFNDEILKKMGRSHTGNDIKDSINLARSYNFDINMDLIVGLPDETQDSYFDTLDTILKLNPANITIHALAIKRAANLKFDLEKYKFLSGNEINYLIDSSMDRLLENNYLPYYLYRQQHISGNLANIGYSKTSHEGIYNILMMEEVHNIFSFGVGGVSKIFSSDSDKFETIPNFRDLVPYIERFDELLEKKIKVLTKK